MLFRLFFPGGLFFMGLSAPGIISGVNYGPEIAVFFALLALIAFLYEALHVMRRGGLRFNLDKSWAALFALIFLMYGYAVFRGLGSESILVRNGSEAIIKSALISILCYATGLMILLRKHRNDFLYCSALSVAFALLMVISLQCLLLLLGVDHRLASETPQAQEPALLFRALGFDFKRTLLPISSGTVNGSALSLFCFVFGYFFLRKTKYRIIASVLLIPASVMMIFLADTRSAYFAAMLAISWVLLFRKKNLAIWILCAMPILPPVFAFFSHIFAVAGSFAIDRYSDFGMFSGRELIWGAAIGKWLSLNDWGFWLFGGGAYGQVSSGLNMEYAQIFGDFSSDVAEMASLHNSYFQIIVDIGLIGLLAAVLFMAITLQRIALLRDLVVGRDLAAVDGFLGLFIAVLAMGGTEVVLTPYSREIIFFIVFSAVLVAISYRLRSARFVGR